MIEDEHGRASGEGMPEDAPERPNAALAAPAPSPAAAEPSTGTVALLVTAPAFCTSYTWPDAPGGTLTVTRKGTTVSAEDAEALILIAAKSGVTITEVRST